MAEPKKFDKGKPGGSKPGKPSGGAKPGGGDGPSLESNLILAAIVAVMLIFIIAPAVGKLFGFSGPGIFSSDFGQRITAAFEHFISTASYVSIFLSLALVCGIIYTQVMYAEVRKKQQAASAPIKPQAAVVSGPEQFRQAGPDPRWRDIEGLMQSGNSGDWRVAILEADILLEDMLTQMGYSGDSIGDKLKQADRAHFSTLDDAWRAHKVRNTIAHEGASYELSRSEADSVVASFKKVFDEFYFI